MTAYYNEIDEYAAQWLRNLIAAGHIAPGVVDTRSIVDVRPDDIAGFTQCHFFAGVGGWSLAARLAGWPDDRALWTGSCPCQPFSLAGKGEGQADARHLWPEFHRLIAARRPAVVMGEQVAAAVGKSWLDGVYSDLEAIGYACGAAVVPACAVDAPHRRDRLWFVADMSGKRRREGRTEHVASIRHGAPASLASLQDACGDVANDTRLHERQRAPESHNGRAPEPRIGSLPSTLGDGDGEGSPLLLGQCGDTRAQQPTAIGTGGCSAWVDAEWVRGADGKARRVKSGIRLLANGVPARVGKLRAFGNAIVPQVAAEVIAAYLDCTAPVLEAAPSIVPPPY